MKKFLFFTVLLTILFVGGCQKEDFGEKLMDSGEFLSLSGDINFADLQDNDWLTLQAAVARIQLKENKDGTLSVYPETAQAANMSENLFQFIKAAADQYNQDLAFGNILTRSDYQSDGEGGYYGRTDCVAHAVAGALPGVSYQYANTVITQHYGNDGVPANQIEEALGRFGTFNIVETSSLRPGPFSNGVVICQGHAVTSFWITDNGCIVCIDYQNNIMKDYPLSAVKIYQY